MYIVILCVILVLLIVSNNTLEEGISTKSQSTANGGKLITGIRNFPFYNSLPRGLRTIIENFTSFIIFI